MVDESQLWDQLSLNFEKDEIHNFIEVILFVSTEPVGISRINELLGGFYSEKIIQDALVQLIDKYSDQNSGLQILEIAGGFRLATKPQYDYIVRKVKLLKKRVKLSMAALETLAIIAYRQPITTPEIEVIRGVSVASILKNLLQKQLIKIQGRKKTVGKPLIYGTTKEFLEHFGLNDLSSLPTMDEFFDTFNEDIKD